MHLEFSSAVEEQMQAMWTSFYPEDEALAAEFSKRLIEQLQGHPVSTAMLQHFFVVQMNSTAAEALENVGLIIDEIKMRDSEAFKEASETVSAAEVEEEVVIAEVDKDKDEDDHTENESGYESSVSGGIHVHIHTAPVKGKTSKSNNKLC
jgi:hypothetical protein